MKTDTPPQPAHGQKVQVFCLCRHCNQEVEVILSKLGYSDFFDCPKCSKRIDSWLRVPCANKRGFEVHSKETMDEVKDLISNSIERLRGKRCLCVPGFDPCTLCESVSELESALDKLNPPQG